MVSKLAGSWASDLYQAPILKGRAFEPKLHNIKNPPFPSQKRKNRKTRNSKEWATVIHRIVFNQLPQIQKPTEERLLSQTT